MTCRKTCNLPKRNDNQCCPERKRRPVSVISLFHLLRHLGSEQGDRLQR